MAVQRLIKRCLKKDPTRACTTSPTRASRSRTRSPRARRSSCRCPGVDPWRVSRKRALVDGVAAALATVAALVALGSGSLDAGRDAVTESVSRAGRAGSAGQQVERGGLAPLAISPDGSRDSSMSPCERGGPHAALHASARSVRADRDRGHRGRQRAVLLARRTMDRLLRQRRAAAGVDRRRRGAQDLRDARGLERDLGRRRHDRVRRRRPRPAACGACRSAGAHARTADDRRCRDRRAAARLPAAPAERRRALRRDRPIAAGTSPCAARSTSEAGARARAAGQRWRRRAVRAADRPPALCECRRPRRRSVRPGARAGSRLAGAAARTSGGGSFGQRGVRGIGVGDARLHSARVDVAAARARARRSRGTRDAVLRTRAPRTRILACRPTAAGSPSRSSRTTAPTSGSTISIAARRRRS